MKGVDENDAGESKLSCRRSARPHEKASYTDQERVMYDQMALLTGDLSE